MPELTFEILTVLFILAVFAGWVDTLAGGGGLITIPAMLLFGIPPATTIATCMRPVHQAPQASSEK